MASKTFRSIAGGLLAVALTAGLGAAAAGPAAAAAPASTVARPAAAPASTVPIPAAAPASTVGLTAAAPSAVAIPAAAPAYVTVGIFPDPLTCTLAGIATGRPFYCSWWWFVWVLNVG